MADMIPMGKLLEAAQKEYPNLDKEELTALIGLQIEARQQQLKNEMKKIKMDKGGLSKEKNKDIEKASMPKSKPDVINKDIMDMVDFRNYEKEKGELHPEDPRAGDNMDTGKAFYEEGDKTLASEIARLTKLAKERKKFLGKEVNAAKGGSMPNQMEMFEDGGLKDEGNTIDPVSGNDVPPGSTQEEVRDDIPAQLSEGEFVFPADVVRYIGLEKLMMMRQEAKQGLKTMEDMGQMGNSEEATMPDDLPFDMTDLDIEDEEEYNSEDMEMAQGGVVYAANGFAGTTTATNQLGSKASSFGNTATRVQPKTYTPPPIPPSAPAGGFKYGADQADKQGKLQFGNLFKDAGGADEYRTYVNDAGAEIQVPFKNGKVMTGFTIPEGYKLKTEKVDTAKTQTTKTKTARVEQESGDSPDPRDSQTVVSLGGSIGPDGRVVGGKSFAFSINPPKDMGINIITMGKMVAGGITGNYPEGTTFNFQTLDKSGNPIGGVVRNVPADVYQNAKTITDKKGVKRTSITSSSANDLANKLSAMENFDAGDLSYDELNNLGLNTQQIRDNIKNSQFTKEQERRADTITSQKIGDRTPTLQGDDETVTSGGTGTQVLGGISYVDDDPVSDGASVSQSPASQPSQDDSVNEVGSEESPGSSFSDATGYGGGYGATYKGSLITRNKPSKPKKMKRGGLASKK